MNLSTIPATKRAMDTPTGFHFLSLLIAVSANVKLMLCVDEHHESPVTSTAGAAHFKNFLNSSPRGFSS